MRKILCLWKRHQVLFAFFILLQAFSLIAPAQVVVTGKVTGSDGKPLAAVTVQIVNTVAATATDADGNYNLTANLKDGTYTLSFTSVGLKSAERSIQVGATKSFTVDVQLTEDVLGLSEVIVTGTSVATAKKRFG